MAIVTGDQSGGSGINQLGIDIIEDQAAHRDVAPQSGLAGQADLIGPLATTGNANLGGRPRPQVLTSRDYEDPAGRASSLCVTDMIVSDVMG
jgi:hypothetical protein